MNIIVEVEKTRYSESEGETLYLADIGDGLEWYSEYALMRAGMKIVRRSDGSAYITEES